MFPETKSRDKILSVLLYSDRDKKKRKRVNSDLDSFNRFFGGHSSVETGKRNTKSDATSFLVTFCTFAESFPSIRCRVSPCETLEKRCFSNSGSIHVFI